MQPRDQNNKGKESNLQNSIMKTVIGLSLNFDEECLILSWFYDFECKNLTGVKTALI
jgi:hypothetical protein